MLHHYYNCIISSGSDQDDSDSDSSSDFDDDSDGCVYDDLQYASFVSTTKPGHLLPFLAREKLVKLEIDVDENDFRVDTSSPRAKFSSMKPSIYGNLLMKLDAHRGFRS